jgi:flavin reductase (DIM6/NTAB) family NADH-FMN oxidoreductase RutF
MSATSEFDFTAIDAKQRYKLLGAAVTPRPIAWVSTLGEHGELNAAPFSFFNALGEDPPVLGFSILHRSDTDRKDTGENVRREREFVVNLVGEANLEAMNVTAIDFPRGRSEFVEAGLTPAPSTRIRTPRIAQSPVSFECKLFDIVPLGPSRSLVLGEVLAMHIVDEAVIDAQNAYIDARKLRLIGRGEPHTYVRTGDVIRLPAIALRDWNGQPA